MRFLADQDVYQITIDFLISLGFEVVRAKDVGLSQSQDEELLSHAFKEDFILITRDKDFGALVFLKQMETHGVMLLRCDPLTIDDAHKEFEKFLRTHKDMSLKNCFVVIEPNRHRIRCTGE